MLPELCASIRYHHRQRVYAMEQRKRANLALGSFLRMVLGWSLALPKAEQEAIRAKAAHLIDIGDDLAKQSAKPAEKQRACEGIDDPDFIEWQNLIMASIKARAPFDEIEAIALKQMKVLAQQLPVWAEFGETISGFGEASLAVIVAEAGDLSVYPKKGHLWKRMGLAVIDGTRQGGLAKSAPKQEWIEHGYNRERRSKMWNIGDTLIKSKGPYREVYLARKEYERQRAEAAGLTIAPSATIKRMPEKRRAEYMSDGHIHRRAQRYMEKRLLRDLWQAWNRREGQKVTADNRPGNASQPDDTNHRKAKASAPSMASPSLPTGDPDERKAIPVQPPMATSPMPTAHLVAAE